MYQSSHSILLVLYRKLVSIIIINVRIYIYLMHTGCHASCDNCSRPASPAHCLTCINSLTLRGTAPSMCTTDTCGRGEFLDSSTGSCAGKHMCATTCMLPYDNECFLHSLCYWVQGMYWSKQCRLHCLACADETLYRVTTDQPSSSVCVTAAECDDTAVSAFGDRTCIFNQSVSFNYNQLVNYE